MANIPTFQQIYLNQLSSIEAKLNITIPLVGKSFIRALASVQAAGLYLSYLAIGDVQKNIFVDTADPASMGGTLERFGFVKLNRYPFPATAGFYTVRATGTIGGTISAERTFKSNDDALNASQLYILDTEYTLDGTNEFQLRALTLGLDGRLSVGDKLTITSPEALVDSEVEVISEDTIPQAAETIEEYREKVIDAYRLEPQGGAASDYRLWGSEAQGVAEIYPYAKSGAANEINLFIEATVADSTDGKGTPTAAILSDVETAIEQPTASRPSRKPLGVFDVHYLPITPLDVDITIPGGTFTAAQQALILSAMTDEINAIRPFIGGIDVVADKNDIFDVNRISAVILDAVPGSSFGAPVLNVNGSPVSTYTFDNDEIPYLNSISYT